jgi:hypothetical protein
MPRRYSVTTGLVSLAASTTITAIGLASPAVASGATVVTLNVSFDGVSTGLTTSAIPVRVQLVRTTAQGSGGAAYPPKPWRLSDVVAQTAARVGDTTPGAGAVVLKEWLLPPVTAHSPFEVFVPGREFELLAGDFIELKLISQTGMTTCHYVANADFEESPWR